MFDWPLSTRFLTRLNAPLTTAERERAEIILGTARLVLAILGMIAVYVDPTDPIQYAWIAHRMMIFWVVCSSLTLLFLRFRNQPRWLPIAIHSADMIWAAAISMFTQGPNSPFFVYFIFLLVAAGYRWGLTETLATAVVGVGLLDLEAAMLIEGFPAAEIAFEGTFDINGLIIRCSYLLIFGAMIGYIAETQKEQRAESTVLNRLLRQIRAEHGLGVSLHSMVSEYIRIFCASRAYVVMEDLAQRKAFLWQTSAGSAPDSQLLATEIPQASVSEFVRNSSPLTFFVEKTDIGVRSVVLEGESEREVFSNEVPTLPFHSGTARSILSTAVQVGREWFGRIYLIDAVLGSGHEQEMLFAERILSQTAPALHSVFLVRRLRRRAGSIERARLARELHDGAIQSLISAEMQVDVLRRQAERENQPMGRNLEHIQNLLRREVLNLRELMQQMKPLDLSPDQLLDYMADMVDRFRRDTGISAQFTTELQDVPLSPHTCRELVRIVQEGLVNVRKHASAKHVLVRFGRENGSWKLTIDDDGKGFEFEGRLHYKDLVNSARGPAIIKERVRNIGGELELESHPGEGARVEITIPQKGHIAHG